jgi:chromate transport protein ChrA
VNLPTQSQINAGLRYAGGYVATGGAIAVAAGSLPPATVHSLVDAAQKVIGDLQQLVGDSYVLFGLAFPIIMGVVAKFGWNSARPANQKQAIIAAEPNTIIAETTSPAAATQAASAMAAIQNVNKVVAASSIADATPSEKVVSKP